MTRIVLTGGGTAGHVMPHIAMLPHYRAAAWDVHYIGSAGIERELAQRAGLPFHTIQTGKLRRYFSWQNVLDIGRLALGVLQSFFLLLRLKPQLVFSKGGFVSVPVACAAWVLRIPVVSHESDLTPGLANRLIKPFCRLIFHAFPETARYLSGVRAEEVGIPVRQQLLEGRREEGRALCGFTGAEGPTLLFMGGSSGAERINKCLAEILPELVTRYSIIHLTGKGKGLPFQHPRYKAFEYVNEGLEHLMALADAVVCRAGANSLFELRALAKPMLLIPLEIASRGDQVDNARSFASHGWALILRETEMDAQRLGTAIQNLMQESSKLQQAMLSSQLHGGSAGQIMQCLYGILQGSSKASC
jgi:UDP-N-acetylglucosamine--N-acetylmuramyl-(pentapeptide) pyrophosphoryl-undecaprenol N-acetylglucosamine transferase